ncbi:MAG TPA: Rieske 2Fe-2S domain-containing protein [Dehalococcoidia bacterium]|jgi:nitrite reductase/ring-hydroxylating ferredoxin subunit|nr:Rieske 2Fe-2S domain-containing protein [Dehalococcoidia bacterium]
MLSVQDNEYLCRIGPGTPMGNVMRQYWLPAIRSDELPAPDCPPLRVKLLGEELIGFRTTSGKIGLIQNACPHRGASMFFGRNEEEGLRCVYHGWKFDTTGACVDMPSEPAESNFRTKVRTRAYPTYERNGIIWAYMGPREVPPPLPDIEANLLCEGPHQISVLHRPCNWMQGWEGEMDTVHAAFLHGGQNNASDYEQGSFNYYQYKERAAKFSTLETEYGLANGAFRPAEADTYYWRVTQILFPFYNMIPTGSLGDGGVRIGAYVPVDDDHTLHWEIQVMPGAPSSEPFFLRGSHPVPNTTGWYGRFNVEETLENDYLIDRDLQKRNQGPGGYTGIVNGRLQDCAVTETMGTIYDRSHEHLGTTDQFIIRARRRMIMAARALEQGVIPPGVDQPWVYRQRSGEMILPRTQDWWQTYTQRRETWLPKEAPAPTPEVRR